MICVPYERPQILDWSMSLMTDESSVVRQHAQQRCECNHLHLVKHRRHASEENPTAYTKNETI